MSALPLPTAPLGNGLGRSTRGGHRGAGAGGGGRRVLGRRWPGAGSLPTVRAHVEPRDTGLCAGHRQRAEEDAQVGEGPGTCGRGNEPRCWEDARTQAEDQAWGQGHRRPGPRTHWFSRARLGSQREPGPPSIGGLYVPAKPINDRAAEQRGEMRGELARVITAWSSRQRPQRRPAVSEGQTPSL